MILAIAIPTAAFAHGVVGDYVFLEPLITQDPTPANELDILAPSWVKSSDANTYSIEFSIEKVLYMDDDLCAEIQRRRRQRLEPRFAIQRSRHAGVR